MKKYLLSEKAVSRIVDLTLKQHRISAKPWSKSYEKAYDEAEKEIKKIKNTKLKPGTKVSIITDMQIDKLVQL